MGNFEAGGLLSPKDVSAVFRLQATARNRHVQTGLLPAPIKLNARVDRWPAAEIERILEARAAGLDSDEIRLLVRRLHAERQARATELRAAQ